MISKDILKYAQEHWLSDSGYKKTITEISKSGTSKALVESSKEIFCFDDISRDLYSVCFFLHKRVKSLINSRV